ncbi:MAG: Gfo/Idh/MocA family oxidoreductase [Candidatus Sumerlaeia bacterium]|nr:Gfo/Idh/MocA family oxidoreductase [Candidatus Sumerlaeia bacterium]
MKHGDVTRRAFLKTSAAGAAAAAAAGQIRTARGAEAKKDEVVLGFIGVGGRGTTLLRKVVTIPGIRVGAVCDLRSERVAAAQRVAEQFKPKGYENFKEMIEKEKLDGIIVATEVANHAKVVIPLLEANIHTFSEKPMDSTVEKVDAIVKAARKSKAIYQVGFQRRYSENFIKAIEKIHSGDLGKVVFLAGDWQFTSGVGGWVINVEMSGGKLVEQACHHMDVMAWVMKNQHPVEAVGMGAVTVEHKNPPKYTAEDHSSVVFRFPGDIIFTYTHTSYCPEKWYAEKLWVYGQGWGINLSAGELYTPDKQTVKIAESSDYYVGTGEQLEDFADNIRTGGKRKPNSNAETARVATLMALMGRAAFHNMATNRYESRIIKWSDLGTTTDA